jgi:hypothetical protein
VFKTSFISLSNQEVRDFVKSNPHLETLAQEAEYFDGNLKEENSKAKENTRTELGALHSALALNHELSQSNDKEVLENVLKLMHNSAMRIVNFFEHIIQTDPSKEREDHDQNADIVIKKNIFDGAVYYSLKQKDGKNITISLHKDADDDSNYYDSYGIEYSDSLETYSKIQTNPGKELRSTEESLEFFAQYNADHFKLKSIKAHSYDHQKKPGGLDGKTAANNMDTLLKALGNAEEKIPLQRLDLHQDTPYIQKLRQALEKSLPS